MTQTHLDCLVLGVVTLIMQLVSAHVNIQMVEAVIKGPLALFASTTNFVGNVSSME